MNLPRHITVPKYVRTVNVGPTTVIVNYRNGRVETLIGPAAQWWTEATASGYAYVPGILDRQHAQELHDQLLKAGLIVPVRRHRPGHEIANGPRWVPSWGTQEIPAGRTDSVRVPLNATMSAAVALAVVLGVLRAGRGHRRMARLLHLLSRAARRGDVPATVAQVHQAIRSVRRVGLVVPGRVACLEESAAVVVLLAVSHRRVTWCHGAAADPVRLHAWVETDDGHRVAEPPSTARFAVLLTIPERTNGGESDHRTR
ncbi:hypothetical protein GCM10022254_01050 [Actinomadura meridiana]|uniref:Microcin J25-processing protein McjB C-terminal domain-containing protein n=1 Tax=Actinomadura meridiana TaxID=559626 RepID=A0ABP8BS67_9ACTN